MVSGRDVFFSGVAARKLTILLQATLVKLTSLQKQTKRFEVEEERAGKRWESVGVGMRQKR